jgi:membrane protein involved in colicin uptake
MLKNKKLTLAFVIVVILIGVLLAVLVITELFAGRKSKYHVVLGYEGQANYIAAVQADPAADKDVLYQKYVTGVYQEDCLDRS